MHLFMVLCIAFLYVVGIFRPFMALCVVFVSQNLYIAKKPLLLWYNNYTDYVPCSGISVLYAPIQFCVLCNSHTGS